MHRKFWIALSMVAFAVLLVAVADAAQEFSNKDVDGPMAFAFDGFVTAGTATVPAAATGRFTADGRGNIADGARTLVINRWGRDSSDIHLHIHCERRWQQQRVVRRHARRA
jgi:hypothetical protein